MSTDNATTCAHCGEPIEQCQFGCWHHAGGRASIFCESGQKIAEPKR